MSLALDNGSRTWYLEGVGAFLMRQRNDIKRNIVAHRVQSKGYAARLEKAMRCWRTVAFALLLLSILLLVALMRFQASAAFATAPAISPLVWQGATRDISLPPAKPYPWMTCADVESYERSGLVPLPPLNGGAR